MRSKRGVTVGVVLALVLPALLPRLSVAAGTPDDALARAVRDGDAAAARALLARHADPNRRLADGSTPLAWAVERQDREIVRLLLDRGAKPNDADPAGADRCADGRVAARCTASLSPLILACEYGDAAILDMLLTARADAQAAGAGGVTPLSVCAGSASAAILKRLIAAGAAVDAADDNGQTPLMWAAAKGRVENIELLVEHGAAVNQQTHKGFTPLFFALKSGDPQASVAVLEVGGDAGYVAPDGTSVVQLAMYQKDYGFAARMIERGANLTAFDRNGYQLLHAAVLANQPSLVKLLLGKGADANALTGASKVQWRYEVNFKSAPYEAVPKSALLLASERGSASIMQMLVDAGADTKVRAADGTNIVLAAATSGKLAALELALQLEPDPNTTTSDGQTPLHLLLGSEARTDTEAMIEIGGMMKLLAAKGARTDIKNHAGQTPADVAKEAESNAKTAFETAFAHRLARNP
jgi:ankyrin repeat protein